MTAPAPGRRDTGFFVGFLLVALVIAGGLSYLASSSPDGLDSVTLQGCDVTGSDVTGSDVTGSDVTGAEVLTGTCIAQNARDSATAGSPLADYAVGGGDGTVGFAGIIGVAVTLVVAGGLFRLLRRRGRTAGTAGPDS